MLCDFSKECNIYGTSKCSVMCPVHMIYTNMLGMSGIPKKYKTEFCINELEDVLIKRYINNLSDRLSKNIGLYLYSETTGTGKTLRASLIAKEFIKYYTKKSLKKPLNKHTPVVFIRFSDFHNVYIQQFRDNDDLASKQYYNIKNTMKYSEVLVIDDLGIRNLTEALEQEVYEIINTRYELGKIIIITSNLSLDKLKRVVGDRVYSRLKEVTVGIEVKGDDRRLNS